jgi:hypothetical protein
MEGLTGFTLINRPPSHQLNPKLKNVIISNSNLVGDPVLWAQLFQGFWREWKCGYSPKFIVQRGRIVTTVVNANSKLSRIQELEESIRSILSVQNSSQNVNMKVLIQQIEQILGNQ